VFNQELLRTDSLLLETAKEMGAKRIFVDGINLLGRLLGGKSETGYRELLHQLIESLNRENLTAMFSFETGTSPDAIAPLEMTDFLVDTVIQLGRERVGRRTQRSLEILKSRGQDYDSGKHTLHYHRGQGLEVFRRVQAPLRPRRKPAHLQQHAVGHWG
jgi:circadian clock protein KaiC